MACACSSSACTMAAWPAPGACVARSSSWKLIIGILPATSTSNCAFEESGFKLVEVTVMCVPRTMAILGPVCDGVRREPHSENVGPVLPDRLS